MQQDRFTPLGFKTDYGAKKYVKKFLLKKSTKSVLKCAKKSVVYFDQQMHACACVCMVKMITNALKLSKTYFFHHAHEGLM